jgi:hypothetical protein
MKKGYSVIVFKVENPEDNLADGKEVRRFNERTLGGARTVFSHQVNNLMWSRQHKLNLGLKPEDHGVVWLLDHDTGFELEEGLF